MEPAFSLMAIASVVHAAEEYVYPGGFLRWMRLVFPRSAPGPGHAVVINAIFLAFVFSPFFSDARSAPVVALSIAGLLLANGVLHVAGSFLTGHYSPGAITSVLCYFPSAIYALVTLPVRWHMTAMQVFLALLLGCFWQSIPLAFMALRR